MHLGEIVVKYLDRKIIIRSFAYAFFASIGFFFGNFFSPSLGLDDKEAVDVGELLQASIIGFFMALLVFILVFVSVKLLERN